MFVARAARKLDHHYPGWENRINLDTLDLHSTYNCVLGQIYGHYLNDRARKAGTFGIIPILSPAFLFPGYTGAWKLEVKKRRAGSVVAALDLRRKPKQVAPLTFPGEWVKRETREKVNA